VTATIFGSTAEAPPMDLLRLRTACSVDVGYSTLIGRLL